MDGPKAVFLDVDGVLHPLGAASFFHAPCMSALRSIVEQTGAALVLSSSWQSSRQSAELVDAALRMNGLPPCVDQTVAPDARGRASPSGEEAGRADEIRRYVEAHPERCAGGWVAVDDTDLNLAGHFVRTDASSGLTPADADAAIRVLGGPDARAPPLPPPPPKPGGFNVLVTRGEVQREMMRAALAET